MTIIDINYPITMSEMQARRGRTAWLEGFSLNSPLNVPLLPTLDLSINTSTHTQELEGSTQRRLPSGPLCHPSSPCPSKPPISLGSPPCVAWNLWSVPSIHSMWSTMIRWSRVIRPDQEFPIPNSLPQGSPLICPTTHFISGLRAWHFIQNGTELPQS